LGKMKSWQKWRQLFVNKEVTSPAWPPMCTNLPLNFGTFFLLSVLFHWPDFTRFVFQNGKRNSGTGQEDARWIVRRGQLWCAIQKRVRQSSSVCKTEIFWIFWNWKIRKKKSKKRKKKKNRKKIEKNGDLCSWFWGNSLFSHISVFSQDGLYGSHGIQTRMKYEKEFGRGEDEKEDDMDPSEA
jgi:hypothetical protein